MHRSPQLLPDGRSLLFAVGTTKGARAEILDPNSGERTPLTDAEDAAMAQYVDSGHLLFAHNGQLLAAPFDPGGLKIKGSPVPVLPGLFGFYNFNLAANGTLFYVPAVTMNENSLVLVDRQGQPRTLTQRRFSFAALFARRNPRRAQSGPRHMDLCGGWRPGHAADL